jgi:hypothetical protein
MNLGKGVVRTWERRQKEFGKGVRKEILSGKIERERRF